MDAKVDGRAGVGLLCCRTLRVEPDLRSTMGLRYATRPSSASDQAMPASPRQDPRNGRITLVGSPAGLSPSIDGIAIALHPLTVSTFTLVVIDVAARSPSSASSSGGLVRAEARVTTGRNGSPRAPKECRPTELSLVGGKAGAQRGLPAQIAPGADLAARRMTRRQNYPVRVSYRVAA